MFSTLINRYVGKGTAKKLLNWVSRKPDLVGMRSTPVAQHAKDFSAELCEKENEKMIVRAQERSFRFGPSAPRVLLSRP
jgi:hypothetical protein